MSFLNARCAVLVGAICALCSMSGVPTAAQSKPSITVGALRIVGPGIGDPADETRPFNEGNGTTIVLYVKPPSGGGIVYIDDKGSVVDSASDDKGTDLRRDVSFGSFPDVLKDGSAAMIEVSLGARPTKGATALVAAGSLGITSGTATKSVKTPNVALVQGKTFKVGTIPVTVSKAEIEDDATLVTFNMPRGLLRAIKSIAFQDGKGNAIDSDPYGTSFTNDEGSMDFKVRTTAKTLTVSCEVWQPLKTEKVPFKITAGLGL
jgi:hypothetical protein